MAKLYSKQKRSASWQDACAWLHRFHILKYNKVPSHRFDIGLGIQNVRIIFTDSDFVQCAVALPVGMLRVCSSMLEQTPQYLNTTLYHDKVTYMQNTTTTVWDTVAARQFADAIAAISDPVAIQNFLRDVMTEKEIVEISSRLQAAGMLQQGRKYTEIIERTRLSSRTIARISDWMQNGCGGYDVALQLINKHHGHTSPARAE